MSFHLLMSVATLLVAWPFALRARGRENRTVRMVVLLIMLSGGLVVAPALPSGLAGGLDVALGIIYL